MKELPAHARLEEEEEGTATQQPPDNGGEEVFSSGELVRHPWNVRMFERFFPDSSYATPLLMGCIITSLAATPGQSFFLGLYTERVIEEFEVSRTVASSLFGAAFACSAIIVQFVGRFIDRYGARRVIVCALPLYMLGLLCLSNASNIYMVGLGYVMNRVLGVETIDMSARVTVNKWFSKRRGMAMSLLGVVLGMQILCSGAFNAMMVEYGWRKATGYVAMLSCAEILIGLAIIHNTPEEIGLSPDGGKKAPDSQAGSDQADNDAFTFSEAMATPQVYVLMWVFFWPAIGWGGMNVHLKSILGEQGLDESTVSLVYLAIGTSAPAASMMMGYLLDRSPTTDSKARKVALVPLLSVFTLLLAASIDGLWMGMFFGAMTGLFVGAYQVAGFTILATLYGRKHIGSIQAVISGLGILGVATGPLVLGIAKEMLGSYTPCLAVLALLSLVAVPLTATMPAPRRGTGQAMWSISWEAVMASSRPGEQDTANVNIDVVVPGEAAVDSVHDQEGSAREGTEMTEKGIDHAANKT